MHRSLKASSWFWNLRSGRFTKRIHSKPIDSGISDLDNVQGESIRKCINSGCRDLKAGDSELELRLSPSSNDSRRSFIERTRKGKYWFWSLRSGGWRLRPNVHSPTAQLPDTGRLFGLGYYRACYIVLTTSPFSHCSISLRRSFIEKIAKKSIHSGRSDLEDLHKRIIKEPYRTRSWDLEAGGVDLEDIQIESLRKHIDSGCWELEADSDLEPPTLPLSHCL